LEIHAILMEILGEHAPLYATIKNWVAQFTRSDFSTFFNPGQAKDLSAPRYMYRHPQFLYHIFYYDPHTKFDA
jgi:hypothetical protein